MEDAEGADAPKKKNPMVGTIIAAVVVTILGGGGGWFVGGLLAPSSASHDAPAAAAAAPAAPAKAEEHGGGGHGEKKPEGLPHAFTEAGGVLQLDPMTVNLAYPSENWIRLELALVFKEHPDVAVAKSIQDDLTAYLRTVSLQQIQGPRGFQYLKDDIQERVDLRSEGRVSDVIFRTFVVQ
ncbi:flagellar basal body protein FliL [Xaviernesmea oryzae]|uniref:Flagellar protein FliL n=1 Tax=Xaviernesmea oryzae TaxID=464029 RepID=A0A1Q9ARX5_9HYPH|nr:flagellar basal body-associated FliL family protein [Xaviernesmea oryzae]OLP58184.1 flagellar basal body protein FliL [Xaviernesmea oryzae]SEL47512.1 flagellar FliL protein [Xaviernesmea oryzae]